MLHAARAAAGAGTRTVALWHESLRPFGAGQLNDRFRRRFGEGMDGDAWATWMALKVAVEASLRTRSTAAADLAAYLAKPGVRFDGHKGRPLAFGPADHQLHQPLYLVGVDSSGAADAREIRLAWSTRTPGCGRTR
jgi:ABC transporter substrate binding protein (PQQ-dependent alcohol dehydrogenase system)